MALDFVIVAVPHHAGRAVIEECAVRGVHVLKEKPFATSLPKAREFASICQQAQVELMVTLQRRFNPFHASVVQLLDQIGTPFLIDGQYTFHTDDPGAGWRGDVSQAGGGCVIDMGYHIVDLLLWYFGMPNRIMADFSTAALPDGGYDAEDTAVIQLGYDNDLYGTVRGERHQHADAVGPLPARLCPLPGAVRPPRRGRRRPARRRPGPGRPRPLTGRGRAGPPPKSCCTRRGLVSAPSL